MVSSLLAETPNAKVLVTSREPLHVDSEQRYAVEPLPETDATILFVERAQAVDAGFAPQPAVTEICRRLDGLPLAIELAAARVAMLDPDELLDRLEERLPLLTSRSHSAPERQRTLRATIEWSYQLLSAEEQSLFRRLAAFRGSFSVEAAEAVCGCDLDLLESLVLKSLVRRWGSGRLGMLDTIREFAIAAVEESTEADVVQRAHAEYFLRIAEDLNMNAGSFDARRPVRFDVAMVEQDNFRAALAWAAAGGDVTLGLRHRDRARAVLDADRPHGGHALVRAPLRGDRSRGRAARDAGRQHALVRELDRHRGLPGGGRTLVRGKPRALRGARRRARAGRPAPPAVPPRDAERRSREGAPARRREPRDPRAARGHVGPDADGRHDGRDRAGRRQPGAGARADRRERGARERGRPCLVGERHARRARAARSSRGATRGRAEKPRSSRWR